MSLTNFFTQSIRTISVFLIWFVLILLFYKQEWWGSLLAPFASTDQAMLYEQNSLLGLFQKHAVITLYAMLFVILCAIPLGIFVTRKSGAAFLPLARSIATISQTLPPMAVLFYFYLYLVLVRKVLFFHFFYLVSCQLYKPL